MSSFGGRVEELQNVLIDNFLLYSNHTCFFLSHCHSDHMKGIDQLFQFMNKNPNTYVYCSSVSRLILLSKYTHVSENVIKELTESKVITVPGNDMAPSYQVTVTPVPAGHCLGSIMFLFETVCSTILYTGDFRLLKNDISKFKFLNNKNQVKIIDKIYLDSTFLNKIYWDFPSRFEVVTELVNLIQDWICQSTSHNVLIITSASYGYEFAFVELAKKLKCKIHVKNRLHDLYYNIPEVGCFLTKECKSTKIHAFHILDKKCQSLKSKKLLRIKLSSQWYKSDKGAARHKMWRKVSKQCIRMCYSTHCSCSELVDFLNYLKPKEVVPCVTAIGSTEDETKSYIQELSFSWYLQKPNKDLEITKTEFQLEKNFRFKLEFPHYKTDISDDLGDF